MSGNFKIEIISPDETILKSEAVEVTIPSYEGQMGILKDHISLITFLRPGLITITQNSEKIVFFVEEGTVEFSNNNLLILSSTAQNLNSLNKNSIDTIIQSAKNRIADSHLSDKEKYFLSYKIDTLKEIN